jgi:hypothetical protein
VVVIVFNVCCSSRYSSPIPELAQEIASFAFIMPVDDPKNFVYLWVLYGRFGMEYGEAKAQLHSFAFRKTAQIQRFGTIYQVTGAVPARLGLS